MIYVVLALMFLLFIPNNKEGCILSFSIFLVIGWLISGWSKNRFLGTKKTAFEIRITAGTVVIAAILGIYFYFRYTSFSWVAIIAGNFGLSVPAFVGSAALFLACAAVWSMSWLIHEAANVLERETCSLDFPSISNQADCIAVKLDRSSWLLCAALALFCAVVFCNACPFAGRSPSTDSSVFLYIGREMLQGKVPYVDLFDHKGIIIYFIQCMGLLLSLPGTYSGVWLIEWASLFVTAVFMYKTVRMLTSSKTASYLVLLIIVFAFASSYIEGGNYTEEYALPWIAMATYVYLKFFKTLRYRPVEVTALGVGCAVIAFLRVNMIGIWIAFTPLVVFFLLKERKCREILCCIGYFVGGLAAVCVPLGIYFVLTGSLDNMIKYYIQFNISYSGSKASVINQLKTILAIGSGAHLAAVSFAVMVYRYVRFKKIFLINMWGFAVSLFFATMSGRTYSHYGLILFPLLVIPTWCTFQIVVHCLEQMNASKKNTRISWMFRNQRRVAVAAACLVVLITVVPAVIRNIIDQPDPIAEYLSEETNKSDDVLIIGNSVRYYLESDRKTENRFFYQFPPIGVSDALYEEFLEELNRNPSDYILFCNKDHITGKLKDCLDQWCQEEVYVYEDHGSFAVYRHKDSRDFA